MRLVPLVMNPSGLTCPTLLANELMPSVPPRLTPSCRSELRSTSAKRICNITCCPPATSRKLWTLAVKAPATSVTWAATFSDGTRPRMPIESAIGVAWMDRPGNWSLICLRRAEKSGSTVMS